MWPLRIFVRAKPDDIIVDSDIVCGSNPKERSCPVGSFEEGTVSDDDVPHAAPCLPVPRLCVELDAGAE